jgi:hypothetical protein
MPGRSREWQSDATVAALKPPHHRQLQTAIREKEIRAAATPPAPESQSAAELSFGVAPLAGTTPMVLDEFGRCAKCVRLGFWKPDA